MILKLILVFVITVIVNFFWALTIKHIQIKKAFLSGSYSILTALFSALVIIEYVNDKIFLIPYGLGSFIGVYVVVKYFK